MPGEREWVENLAEKIEEKSRAWGFSVAGRVRYDPAVTKAQVDGKSIVEAAKDGAAADIRRLWNQLSD